MSSFDQLAVYLFHPLTLSLALFVVLFIFIIYVGKKYNGADWGNTPTNILDGWLRLYVKKYQRQGDFKINLPPDTPLILAANHISSIDPFLLVTATDRPIRFMIAKEEYERPIFNWMFKGAGCIPVDRGGRVEGAFRSAMRAINQGELVSIFPQGGIHCEEKQRPIIKQGIIKLSALTQCSILPVRINGISAPGTMVECVVKRGHITLDVAPMVSPQQVQLDSFRAAISQWYIHQTDSLELSEDQGVQSQDQSELSA